ncbi:WD40 repeat domain-containing protein [Streptomyces sp. NPDC052415]|uniref:WD40 repeat domain-containing protein n=1 Tax=Streptomyces sp. NPDC052415 TaxID=3365690 RepID=UPI0037D94762
MWRPDLPAPADGSPGEPLLALAPASLAVGDMRLDLAGGVLRLREAGRTSAVRTYSLHGLAGPAWSDRAAGGGAETGGGRVAVLGRTALTDEGAVVDASTGRRIEGAEGVTGEHFLRAAAFSPDGRYLVAEDVVGRLTLWDARTWRRLAVLRAAASTVHRAALTFSADGTLLAAGAPDGSVQVWETATPGLAAATLPAGDGPAVGLAFAAGELRITSAHLALRKRPLSPERAAAEVCDRAAGGASETEWRRHLPSVPYRETCGDGT